MNRFRKYLRWPTVVAGLLVITSLLVAGLGQAPMFGAGASQVETIDLTEEDMVSFVEVNKQMIELQVEAEKEMVEIIEEQGFSIEKYIDIVTAENNPEAESVATGEELEKAQEISGKMEALDQQLHQRSLEIIDEGGLTPERYNQIAMSLQNSPEYQERYNELMEQELG
ncbi:DUF4168 domain-containing protein [Chitinispirillales bacterium ANBcel5]|uniref:DUF4168 domain-containing protein n=1 Tax=Cellulosispirillum alkaliphilum TaxID=3039283 RepID=UPI002A4FED43|nr:DUF4168 domain-containing protein [Chitinispirillales bacterium ANBcel5]